MHQNNDEEHGLHSSEDARERDECDEGDTYERGGETYECVDGEWVLQL